ncbi:MAG: hypothetical protein HDR38_04295 [Treponema sp.]|nr:hypothetical protein [Treponema sp.]
MAFPNSTNKEKVSPVYRIGDAVSIEEKILTTDGNLLWEQTKAVPFSR